jgi:AbrB family looped-hinge helix DNA binding protein
MATTTLSSKNQVTLPVAILALAGVEAGERLVIEYRDGHIEITKASDLLARLNGSMSLPADFLEDLRSEWD